MTTEYRFGNAELRPDQRMLLVGGKERHIGSRAFDLLLALVERRDRVVAKNELLDSVWPGLVVEENNLQVHISSLRKALGPRAIATVPGRGYRFTGAVDGAAASPVPTPAPAAPAGTIATMPGKGETFTNLPADSPALFGRGRDLAAVRSLVEKHRLVSIVGPGGIGKTSLVQAVAHELLDSFSDGAWHVDLSPLTTPSLVLTTVATTLRIVLRSDAQSDTLANALSSRKMLVVLDNCEHLAKAVAELAAALYAGAPGVKVLATSQEPLKVAQEHVYRLGPLELPVGGDAESAARTGAVALFEARAGAADPTFVLDAGNVGAIVDICRHLDGIPLAIELAAARVPLLGVSALRARLGERFRLLGSGSRLAPPRHQTLRAALEWSHGLLTPQEQVVFRRLSVFAGSFALDSAQRVASDAALDDWTVLDLLGALVDKSLIVAEPGESPRYRLPETARAFALEKLHEAGETDGVTRAHALAILAVYEESRRCEFLLPRQMHLDRYMPDLDDARSALDWCASRPEEAQLHVALAGAIAWIWVEAGLRTEGQRRTLAAMSRIDDTAATRAQARILASWSRLAFPEIGPRELAADRRAVEMYQSLGDQQGAFWASCGLATTLAVLGDHAQSRQTLAQAQQFAHPGWPPALRVPLLRARFWQSHHAGQSGEAAAVCAELYQLATALGDQRLAFTTLIAQEQAVAALGRLEESVSLGRELVDLMRQHRSLASCNEGYVYGNLSMSLAELGEVDEALDMARRAYAFREQAGGSLCILDPFARLAFMRGRVDDAARILGRADMRYATSNEKRQPVEAGIRAKLLHDLGQALPPDELARLMQDGERLDDEAAACLALKD